MTRQEKASTFLKIKFSTSTAIGCGLFLWLILVISSYRFYQMSEETVSFHPNFTYKEIFCMNN